MNSFKPTYNGKNLPSLEGFVPREKELKSSSSFVKLNERPGTDIKRKRTSSQQKKHIVIRENNPPLNRQPKQQSSETQQSEPKESIYMFTFNNSDSTTATLAEREA